MCFWYDYGYQSVNFISFFLEQSDYIKQLNVNNKIELTVTVENIPDLLKSDFIKLEFTKSLFEKLTVFHKFYIISTIEKYHSHW